MLRLLSYTIDPQAPTFMRFSAPHTVPLQSIERRNNINTVEYQLHSNSGTHLIAPRHVHRNGYDVASLPVDRFHFERPVVIDIELPQTQLIDEKLLSAHAEAIGQADLLLVRTGWSAMRQQDPEVYGRGNPGFDVSAALYLIDKFPDLKALGMDFVYPSSAHHVSRGLAFQQVILGSADPERFIVLIADLDLSGDLNGLQEVWALPLRVAGGPAAPCTVVARFGEAPAPESSTGDDAADEAGETAAEDQASQEG